MNPADTLDGSTVVPLAASGPGTGVTAFLVGLIVVLFLLGGFWLGRRIRVREPAPPRPSEQPRPPARPTRVEETTEPSDGFGGEGERLTPYQLGGHGTEARRPPGIDDR
ncbi:DUF6479 family protein [Streptomyces sp. NPDC001780]